MSNFYLGVIPARGGSKRVVRKNIRQVGDKPLIGHTITSAQKSKRLHSFVVSSEDNEILEIAGTFTSEKNIIRRPSNLAGDDVRKTECLLHALETFSQNSKY